MNPAREHKELALLGHKIHDIQERLSKVARIVIDASGPNSPCGVDASPKEYAVINDELEWASVGLESIINEFKGLSRVSTKELLEGDL